jgi:hypothetical protein
MTTLRRKKGHEKEFHDESACDRLIRCYGILNVSGYERFRSFCSYRKARNGII